MSANAFHLTLVGGFLALAAVAAPPVAQANDRMAGPVPVSKPADPDAPRAAPPPRQNDSRMAGSKRRPPPDAEDQPAAAAKKTTARNRPDQKEDDKDKKADAPAHDPGDKPQAITINTPRPDTGKTMDMHAMESLGPLTNPLQGSLGHDMWDGSARATLHALIPKLPTGEAMRPAQLLARRVLLSNGDVTMLDGQHVPGGSDTDLFTMRIEKLMEMGAYEDAMALYTLIEGEPSHERLARAGIMALMYSGYPAQACLEARTAQRRGFSTPDENSKPGFWQQIDSICAFIQNQSASNIRPRDPAQNAGMRLFDRTATTGVPGSRILTTLASRPNYRHNVAAPKDIAELEPLEQAVIRGLGRFDYTRMKNLRRVEDVPARLLLLMATDANLPAYHRATLAVEAARRGIIDAPGLGRLYTAIAGKEDKLEASPETLRLWDRYVLYTRSTDTREQQRMIVALIDQPMQGLPTALLPFAGGVAQINPAPLSRHALANGLALMLYANIVPPEKWVSAWLKAESADSDKKTDSTVLYLANILPENLPTNSTPFPDAALDLAMDGQKSAKSLELWSVFAGLGRQSALHNIPDKDAYEKLVDLTVINDYVMPTDDALEQIREASNNGRLGEVALRASVVLSEYSPGKTHPGVFREVLQSLATVGLKEEAQQVALGVVLSLKQ